MNYYHLFQLLSNWYEEFLITFASYGNNVDLIID